MLDELLVGGEMQETSKKNVLKAIAAQDVLQEVSMHDKSHQEVFFTENMLIYVLKCCVLHLI